MIEKPTMLEIESIVDEAKDFKTFIFKYNLKSNPGEFVMVWLPSIDEKPFSISFQDKERFGITVFEVGDFTSKLFKMEEGDKVGIRGPYGNGFSLKGSGKSKISGTSKNKVFVGSNVVLVGGGCGTAPLGFLADELKKNGSEINFIIGSRSKDYLLFLDRMKKAKIKTSVATDDGSFGFNGFTTELLEAYLLENKIDRVYSCGPEIMMKKIVEICSELNVPCEVSLERYMKCGFGLCGQCCMDGTGERVCKEGPVFSGEKVKKLIEFGKYHRSKSGKKVNL
jgi:dihydroorotate dehydrogenase electron transfer subunit